MGREPQGFQQPPSRQVGLGASSLCTAPPVSEVGVLSLKLSVLESRQGMGGVVAGGFAPVAQGRRDRSSLQPWHPCLFFFLLPLPVVLSLLHLPRFLCFSPKRHGAGGTRPCRGVKGVQRGNFSL